MWFYWSDVTYVFIFYNQHTVDSLYLEPLRDRKIEFEIEKVWDKEKILGFH